MNKLLKRSGDGPVAAKRRALLSLPARQRRTISATRARAHLFELFKDIDETGLPVYISLRGSRTLLEISPLSDEELAQVAERTSDPSDREQLLRILDRSKERVSGLWGTRIGEATRR